MAFTIKIKDKNGLCSSCQHSFITKTSSTTEVRCLFRRDEPVVINPIVECNQFDDINHPTKREFEELAWIIKTNEKNVVGFQPPQKKKGRELLDDMFNKE